MLINNIWNIFYASYYKTLRGESVENIDMDFLTDLAFLGSKLMKQAKKMAKSLCKVVPQGQIKGGTFLPNLW